MRHQPIELGTVFGRLTVTSGAIRNDKYTWYVCLCNCGTIVKVRSDRLRAGRTNSCGCLRKEAAAKTVAVAPRRTRQGRSSRLTEWETYGRLKTHLELPGKAPPSKRMWLCECLECGNLTTVPAYRLAGNQTPEEREEKIPARSYRQRTCGCAALRYVRQQARKWNNAVEMQETLSEARAARSESLKAQYADRICL